MSITIEQFNNLNPGRSPSPQSEFIGGMGPNTAAVLPHEGLWCGRGINHGCSLSTMVWRWQRKRKGIYQVKHLEDGTVAIAYIEEGE